MNATFPNTADPSAGAMQPTQPATAPPDAPGFLNPYGRWHGTFVPLWLLERGEIPTGAKMTYAVLCYHASRQGRCFPGQRVLARELAISERQVRANLTTLVAHGMISVVQRGLRRSNVYHFCVHPWQSLTRQRRDQPEEVRQPAAVPEQTPRSALERNLSAGPVGTMDMEAESMEHVPACPSTGEGEGVRSLPSSDLVETIYAAYPGREAGPPSVRSGAPCAATLRISCWNALNSSPVPIAATHASFLTRRTGSATNVSATLPRRGPPTATPGPARPH
jgi:hypothetical protein